jgi:thiol-disulfide isomerase/thioredoxin
MLYHTAILYLGGSNIPDFKYKNFYTNSVSTTKLPFKKTLFIFFTTECGSCDEAASAIYDLSRKNLDFNLVFITEETDSSKSSDYLERNKIKEISDYLFIDQNKSFQKDFGLGITMSIPTILFYDQNGKFVQEIKNFQELLKI